MQTFCKEHSFLFYTEHIEQEFVRALLKRVAAPRRIYIDFGLCFMVMVIMLLSIERKSKKGGCNQLLASSADEKGRRSKVSEEIRKQRIE